MTIEYIDDHHRLFSKVKSLGKKYASTLGFMPEGGYDDYASKKSIIIAREEDELLGYLMFRLTTRVSRIVIAHLVVDDNYRGSGVSVSLLDALRKKYQKSGIPGMILSCRKDYKEASALWSNYGFTAKAFRRSRSIQEHYLTTWWYPFQQKDLFSQLFEESTKVRALVDLNVILKLRDTEKGIAQLRAKEDPRCLLADWLVGETDLCYAPEVLNEINRDDDVARIRETNNYLTGAFTQAIVDPERMKDIAASLNSILPGENDNTQSDRKQVASCITAGIPYFLTFDEGIIKKRQEIHAKYDVEIYTPQEFLLHIDQLLHSDDYMPIALRGVAFHEMSKLDASGLQYMIDAFLQRGEREHKSAFHDIVMSCVNDRGDMYSISTQQQKVAFYGVLKEDESLVFPFLRIANVAIKTSLICQIVTSALQECVLDRRSKIVIKEKYLDADQKEMLVRYGFLADNDGVYTKFIIDRVVDIRELNQVVAGLGLVSKTSPIDLEQLVRIERVLYPLKIRDLGIPCYIIPIKAYWAGQLFDNVISGESLFGAAPGKLWNFENVYFRHTRPITERAPARILWYVSGNESKNTHSKKVVACSYLSEVHTGKGQDLYRRFKHYGIYEWQHIYELCGREKDKDIRALKFSHTELFNCPVDYETVQRIMAQNGFKRNTFAGPVLVSNEVFIKIYEMGRSINRM